jgi:uncharacterized protein
MTISVDQTSGASPASTPANPSVGQFVWADLMTKDQDAALRYYAAVTGWTVTFWDMGPTKYAMWTVPGRGPDATIGGVMQMPPDDPNGAHWMLHLSVSDCAARTAQAASLGATVLVPPQEVPTVGQFAVIRDPQGATVSLFTPLQPMPKGMPAVGEFSWFELGTTDRAAAVAFYSALVGWEAGALHDMGGGMLYQEVQRPGDHWPTAGIYTILPSMPMTPAWTPYVRVADVEAAAARMTAHGGQLFNGPMEVPGGDRVAFGADAEGALFAVHQMAAG